MLRSRVGTALLQKSEMERILGKRSWKALKLGAKVMSACEHGYNIATRMNIIP